MISTLQYILFGILCITLLVELAHYLLLGIKLQLNRQHINQVNNNITDTVNEVLPPVSVIICTRNEAVNLQNFLPLVLEQDYPEYQVIVVNDGSIDDTEEVVVNLRELYPHLYLTNIPKQTRIISHKKLAITIGVKAAKHELLIFTDADCRPWTPHWIEDIVRSYTPNTQFVLAYSSNYSTKSLLSRMISYDTSTAAIQYLGLALCGKPYKGVGRNLSYLKSTFITNKGFAGNLHIQSGEDDLLVNQLSTKDNTAINSTLRAKTISIPKKSFLDWYYFKLRHISALSAYTTRSKIMISIEPIVRTLFYLVIVCAAIIYPNVLTVTAVFAALILKIFTQTIVINSVRKYYNEKKFNPFDVLFFDIILPIISLYISTIGKLFHRKSKWE